MAPNTVEEISALYTSFAHAFLYPEEDGTWLTGAEYLEAFDMGASKSAISPNERAYSGGEASALFEELVRFYEYFGLSRQEKAELPDHLGVELEFMHFLCESELHAEAGSPDIDSLNNAQREFLDRHVLRLLKGMQQGLAGKDGNASELVHACVEFVEWHRQALFAQRSAPCSHSGTTE